MLIVTNSGLVEPRALIYTGALSSSLSPYQLYNQLFSFFVSEEHKKKKKSSKGEEKKNVESGFDFMFACFRIKNLFIFCQMNKNISLRTHIIYYTITFEDDMYT